MAKRTISIRRMLLGMVFVALPFSAFGGFGLRGIIVAAIIAFSMFTACCIASRDQLQSMFGIIACTIAVLFFGAIFAPAQVNGRFDFTTYWINCGSIGCIVGILWSESFYYQKRREKSLASEKKEFQSANDDRKSILEADRKET